MRVAGMAAERHTIVVVESRYEREGRMLNLARSSIVMALQMPSGGIAALQERVSTIIDKAKKLVPDLDVEFALDVTRSPLVHDGFPKNPLPYMLTTTGLDRYSAPFRYLGRLLLLSNFQVQLRDRRLIPALPQESDDPIVVTRKVLERALSTVQAKLPKSETEEAFLSDTSPDDDLALTTGLAVFLANERMLSAEDMRFVKERSKNSHQWVI